MRVATTIALLLALASSTSAATRGFGSFVVAGGYRNDVARSWFDGTLRLEGGAQRGIMAAGLRLDVMAGASLAPLPFADFRLGPTLQFLARPRLWIGFAPYLSFSIYGRARGVNPPYWANGVGIGVDIVYEIWRGDTGAFTFNSGATFGGGASGLVANVLIGIGYRY